MLTTITYLPSWYDGLEDAEAERGRSEADYEGRRATDRAPAMAAPEGDWLGACGPYVAGLLAAGGR